MTPQALFLYLSQTRHFSEDVAQEVVIEYLQGKMNGAKSLKAWASRRAKWRTLDARKKVTGRDWRHPRSFQLLDPALSSQSPSPFTRAAQRQQIDTYILANPAFEWANH